MTALVVGDPRAGALESCAALPSTGTLVWTDADALREAADALEAIEWEALLVLSDDEGFSTASMAFLAQTHGRPPGVVIHAGNGGHEVLIDTAIMVARHLPVVPVIVTGPGASAAAALWEEPRLELELEAPSVVSQTELADAWSAVEAMPPAETPATTATHHHH